MEGIPTYSQTSVAFPDSPQKRRVADEVLVSFAAEGGGTHGEFCFEWYDFSTVSGLGRREPAALKVGIFMESLDAFMDPRIQAVMAKVLRLPAMPSNERNVTPETLIGWLEAEGVVASHYHLKALLDREDLSLAERGRIQAQYETMKRHEDHD